nr:hypothetical protein [Nocardia brasiliensis]
MTRPFRGRRGVGERLGDPVQVGGGDAEAGVAQAEWTAHSLLDELVQRPAVRVLEYPAQHVHRHAVLPHRAGVGREWLAGQVVHHLVERVPRAGVLVFPHLRRRVVRREVRRGVESTADARGLPQQIL